MIEKNSNTQTKDNGICSGKNYLNYIEYSEVRKRKLKQKKIKNKNSQIENFPSSFIFQIKRF